MKDKLLITNRPITGKNDGPEIILDSIFQECDVNTYDFCCDFKITDSAHNVKPKIKIPFLHIHREIFFLLNNFKKIKSYKTIVIFSFYSCPLILFLIKIIKKIKPRIIIIGYDSYYRENIIKMKKQKSFLKKIQFFFKSLTLNFVEYLASISSDKIYLVSKECVDFSINKVNKQGSYKCFPLLPKINKDLFIKDKDFDYKNLLIIGPFITEIDMIDLKINLDLISNLKFIENIHFFGKDSYKAKSISSYPGETYEYIDDFDSYFSQNSNVIIYNRINTPGIQTKLQKIIMYNNLVFCHSGIDVGNELNAFCHDIKDCINLKDYRKQVNLEDIVNASDNTLNELKLIVKDF